MKKLFILFLALVASIGTMFAWDYERVQIGDLYYNLDATNQTAEVAESGSASGDILIPASVTYDEITYSVTSIGSSAFSYCTGLTSVTIPNSVTSIGSSAFLGCSSLTSVTIPNSVTSIERDAFSNCTGLTSVTIPNSVTSIGSCAFSGCSGLASIEIPNSVTSIGWSAFEGCTGLTSIACKAVTPPTCEYLSYGKEVFDGVDKSIPLYIPAESIDAYKAAYQWKDFTNIQVIPGSSCMQAKDFDFINGNIQEANSTIWYEFDIEKLLKTDNDVQFTFTNLGNNSCLVQIDAFPTCEDTNPFDQTTFTLSAGWTRSIIFPHAAFESDADSILYFHIYSEQKLQFNAQLVDPEPFDPIICGNYNIIASNIEIPQEAGSSWYLIDMKDIRTKTMGDGVLKIKNLGTGDATIVTESAYHCPVTTRPLSITINLAPGEEYTRTINRSFAMQHESVILHITTDMPISIRLDFDKCHFAGTCGANGDNLTWELSCDGVLTISGTGEMMDWDFPSSSPWYSYRSSIQHAIIENSVTSIGMRAFESYSSLTSVEVPNSVTSIGYNAFFDCTGLTSVTIPNSVTSIGDHAFRNCSSLNSIEIPNNVTSIGDNAFSGCSGLTSILVEEGNTVYDSRDNSNAIIETATNILIAGCSNSIIPNSVTSIGSSAFFRCNGLTSIEIPNSVISIGGNAFFDCSGLTSVTIPNSVTSIGEWAFSSCSSLTSVTIPNSVTSIGNFAFYYCTGLTSITCEAVTPPTLGSNVFGNVNKSIPLYVPSESIDHYKAADQWKEFTNILPIPGVEPEKFSITWQDEDGNPIKVDEVAYGETPVFSGATPAKEATAEYTYEFAGWLPKVKEVTEDVKYTTFFERNKIEPTVYTVNINGENCSLRISNEVPAGTTLQVEAVADECFEFQKWSDNNTDNPRTITVTEDSNLTAEFNKVTYTIIGENENEGGEVQIIP